MAQKIEAYIASNKEVVTDWLKSLFSGYILVCTETDKPAAQFVSTQRICTDSRRLPKCLEVLGHYNLIDKQRYIQGDVGGYYDILVNKESFIQIAPAYGERYNFEVKAPNPGGSRIESYPFLKDISKGGIIHWYFNQDEYLLVDNPEYYTNAYGNRIKSTHNLKRVYPKNLESSSERAVFEGSMERYFSHDLEGAIEMLYGFYPEVLTFNNSEQYWDFEKDKSFRRMPVSRCGKFGGLDLISREKLLKRLEDAKNLKLYAEACIRDLTKLIEVFPGDCETFKKDLFEKAEPELFAQAPLMMGDTKTKELATLLLKGSHKGVI